MASRAPMFSSKSAISWSSFAKTSVLWSTTSFFSSSILFVIKPTSSSCFSLNFSTDVVLFFSTSAFAVRKSKFVLPYDIFNRPNSIHEKFLLSSLLSLQHLARLFVHSGLFWFLVPTNLFLFQVHALVSFTLCSSLFCFPRNIVKMYLFCGKPAVFTLWGCMYCSAFWAGDGSVTDQFPQAYMTQGVAAWQ